MLILQTAVNKKSTVERIFCITYASVIAKTVLIFLVVEKTILISLVIAKTILISLVINKYVAKDIFNVLNQ